MKLISPYNHPVTKNFPSEKNPAVLVPTKFEFKYGEPVEVPTDFANALLSTYPDRYYTEKEWEAYLETNVGKSTLVKQAKKGFEIPTLDSLKATDLATLKQFADELGIPYSQNVEPKSLATTIHQLLVIKTSVVGDGEAVNTDATFDDDTTIDYESKKVPELKELLDEAGVEYKANSTKAELIDLLKGQEAPKE